MLPAVGEVVLIQELFARSQAEVRQSHAVRIIAETDAADLADAVVLAVDHEPVQVLVTPAECQLQRGVQVGDRAVVANQEAAPDQRADATQYDL